MKVCGDQIELLFAWLSQTSVIRLLCLRKLRLRDAGIFNEITNKEQ